MASKVTFQLTGFGKFAGIEKNPTTDLVQALDRGEGNITVDIATCTVLEVSRDGSEEQLALLEACCAPEGVTVFVHMGVNSCARSFGVERRAYNQAAFRAPDERGWQPGDEPLDSDLPTSHNLCTAFDVPRLVAELEKRGWKGKVSVSDDAGRFVCNSLYYASLRACRPLTAAAAAGRACIFLHVPPFTAIAEKDQSRFVSDFLSLLQEQAAAWLAGAQSSTGGSTGGTRGSGRNASSSTNGAGVAAEAAGTTAGVQSAAERTVAALVEMGFPREDVKMAMEATNSTDLERNLKVLRVFEPSKTDKSSSSRSSGGGGGGGRRSTTNNVREEEYVSSMSRSTGRRASNVSVKAVLLVRQNCALSPGELAAACAKATGALAHDLAAQGDGLAAAWRRQEQPPDVFTVPDVARLKLVQALAREAGVPAALASSRSAGGGGDGQPVVAALGPGDAMRVQQVVAALRAVPMA